MLKMTYGELCQLEGKHLYTQADSFGDFDSLRISANNGFTESNKNSVNNCHSVSFISSPLFDICSNVLDTEAFSRDQLNKEEQLQEVYVFEDLDVEVLIRVLKKCINN